MTRSLWKGPILSTIKNSGNTIQVSRNATVIPKYVGKNVLIHDGKSLVDLLVKEEMVFRKFGEFAKTVKDFSFKKKEELKKKR